MKEEQIILKGLQQGSEQAYKDLFTAYFSDLVLYANHFIKNQAAAEDIVQDFFITLWFEKKFSNIENGLESYLYRSLHNTCLNHLRNEHLRMEARESILEDELYELDFRIASLDSSDPNRLFSEEIVEIVNRTLGELPEKTRKAFVMSRYQNKSVKEIAGLLNVTVKGADYHIGKALQALRKSLKDYLSSFLFF